AKTHNTSRASFDVDPLGTLSDAKTAARLRLLEALVSRADITECAQVGLQWLEETYGIARSICLVRPIGEASLYVVGGHGLATDPTTSFAVSLDDWNNPLVTAISNRRAVFFPAAHSGMDRKRRPLTPFGDAAFHVL